jgi:hypothetical protein
VTVTKDSDRFLLDQIATLEELRLQPSLENAEEAANIAAVATIRDVVGKRCGVRTKPLARRTLRVSLARSAG